MPWVPIYGTLCQTQVTRVPQATAAGVLILKADPRRMYVEWWGDGMQSSMGGVVPGPMPTFVAPGGNMNAPQIWKFKDCPAIVTGEFYSAGAPFAGWIVIEQLYVGG